MTHVTSNAWYLQWYVLAAIAFLLYGSAYLWYALLGAMSPWSYFAWRLKKRRQRRAHLRQVAEFEARQRANAEKMAEFERQKAAKRAEWERQQAARRGAITIDAEPETAASTSAT